MACHQLIGLSKIRIEVGQEWDAFSVAEKLLHRLPPTTANATTLFHSQARTLMSEIFHGYA